MSSDVLVKMPHLGNTGCDGKAVVSANVVQVAEVASWLEGSDIAEAIEVVDRLTAESEALKRELRAAKKALAKAMQT